MIRRFVQSPIPGIFAHESNLKVNLPSLHQNANFKVPLLSSDGTVTTMFGETPVMSPYLLAFVIADFDYTSAKTGRVTHQIQARKDNGAYIKTQVALRTSDLLLKELERYVSFEYELEKLDQVALPDFQSGLFMLPI